eukprot:GILK01001010.1.p1 GENE.GILK01001010.1~~GILK01001010.1.p1  ORF type:complete len:212 (+),score=50.30 GILK01001010.1:48-638(+)
MSAPAKPFIDDEVNRLTSSAKLEFNFNSTNPVNLYMHDPKYGTTERQLKTKEVTERFERSQRRRQIQQDMHGTVAEDDDVRSLVTEIIREERDVEFDDSEFNVTTTINGKGLKKGVVRPTAPHHKDHLNRLMSYSTITPKTTNQDMLKFDQDCQRDVNQYELTNNLRKHAFSEYCEASIKYAKTMRYGSSKQAAKG